MKKNMKKNNFFKKHENLIFRIVIILLSIVALVSALMIALYFYDQSKSAKAFEEIADSVHIEYVEQPTKPSEPEKAPTPRDVYADVLAQNSDFVGWIKIENTNINYPVVQSETRNYYLRRGFDKNYSYYGVPYAAEFCDVDNSDNVVIYGHNMNNGTMFADLENYTSKSYYKNHKYIKFDTLENFYTYEVIAVLKTIAFSDDEFKYYRFESGNQDQFGEYVNKCKELSLYDTGVSASYGDKLLSLSTCEYSNPNGRLLVVAKRVN